MTKEQTQAVVDALISIDNSMKLIACSLVDIYARVGTIDQELWTPTAHEYGQERDDG